MKPFFYFLFLLTSPFLFGTSIKGSLSSTFANKKMELILMNYDTRKDSLIKEFACDANGKFNIELPLKETSILSFGEKGKTLLNIAIAPNDNLELVFENNTIKSNGSVDTQFLIDYEAFRKSVFKKWLQPVYDSSSIAEKNGDKIKLEYWNKQQTIASDNYKYELSNWVISSKMVKSIAVAHHSLRWHQENDLALMDSILNNLSQNYTQNTHYLQLKSKVNKIKRTAIGSMAPTFSMPNAESKTISLSDFKGKYVLLDFWASWCPPCRQESATLVRLMKKFESKNFTIISISVDDNKEKWLQAIAKDGYYWNNVCDLKAWSSELAVLYSVSAIPNSFLLDREGKIIAKNLRGTDLEKKLAELMP